MSRANTKVGYVLHSSAPGIPSKQQWAGFAVITALLSVLFFEMQIKMLGFIFFCWLVPLCIRFCAGIFPGFKRCIKAMHSDLLVISTELKQKFAAWGPFPNVIYELQLDMDNRDQSTDPEVSQPRPLHRQKNARRDLSTPPSSTLEPRVRCEDWPTPPLTHCTPLHSQSSKCTPEGSCGPIPSRQSQRSTRISARLEDRCAEWVGMREGELHEEGTVGSNTLTLTMTNTFLLFAVAPQPSFRVENRS